MQGKSVFGYWGQMARLCITFAFALLSIPFAAESDAVEVIEHHIVHTVEIDVAAGAAPARTQVFGPDAARCFRPVMRKAVSIGGALARGAAEWSFVEQRLVNSPLGAVESAVAMQVAAFQIVQSQIY